jgi:hypothetical protein
MNPSRVEFHHNIFPTPYLAIHQVILHNQVFLILTLHKTNPLKMLHRMHL